MYMLKMKTFKIKKLEMKKIKPLIKRFTTAKEIAEYYFHRDFQTVSLDMVKNEDGYFDFNRPSDALIAKEFLDEREINTELRERYREDVLDGDGDYEIQMSHFEKWVAETVEFEEYRYGDWAANNEPMYRFVFKCPIDSEYMNVDKLYSLGIGVIDHETGPYLYTSEDDFYEAHWIPLFRALGWIEEVEAAAERLYYTVDNNVQECFEGIIRFRIIQGYTIENDRPNTLFSLQVTGEDMLEKEAIKRWLRRNGHESDKIIMVKL